MTGCCVHWIQTAARTGRIEVRLREDRIEMRLTFTRYGELGDVDEIARQLAAVLRRFDGDPRPLLFVAPDLGQQTRIATVAQGLLRVELASEARQ
jgi:hypothetical protein